MKAHPRKNHRFATLIAVACSIHGVAPYVQADDDKAKEKAPQEEAPKAEAAPKTEASAKPEGEKSQRTGPGHSPSLFSKLDTNQDGKLSAEEIAQASTVLATLDADKDGALSAQESGQGSRGDRHSHRDGNRDGVARASKEEGKHYGERERKGKGKDSGKDAYKSEETASHDDDDDDDDDGGEETANTGGGGGSAMSATVKTWMGFDQNGDGKLTGEELPKRMAGIIEKADTDKDGSLTVSELETHFAKEASAPTASTNP